MVPFWQRHPRDHLCERVFASYRPAVAASHAVAFANFLSSMYTSVGKVNALSAAVSNSCMATNGAHSQYTNKTRAGSNLLERLDQQAPIGQPG